MWSVVVIVENLNKSHCNIIKDSNTLFLLCVSHMFTEIPVGRNFHLEICIRQLQHPHQGRDIRSGNEEGSITKPYLQFMCFGNAHLNV